MIEMEANGDEEPLATEKQRTALIHWGVDRGRAEDPGLTRPEASRWLGALISAKRQDPDDSGPRMKAGVPRNGTERGPVPAPTGPSAGPSEGVPTEPEMLEVEITVPTPIPYSSVRLRTRASRRPGETLATLGDRMTEELIGIVRRETERLERALRPTARPGATNDVGAHRAERAGGPA